MSALSGLKPNYFVALCDNETPKDASNKRLGKSVSKTLDFLDVCIDKKRDDPNLKDTKIFAPIEVIISLFFYLVRILSIVLEYWK